MIQTNQSAQRTGKGYLTFLSPSLAISKIHEASLQNTERGRKNSGIERKRGKKRIEREEIRIKEEECCTNDQVLNSRGQERARWGFHSSHSRRILLFQNNSYSFLSFISSEKASHYSIVHSLFLPSSILHEDLKEEDCDLYHFEVFVLSLSLFLVLSIL